MTETLVTVAVLAGWFLLLFWLWNRPVRPHHRGVMVFGPPNLPDGYEPAPAWVPPAALAAEVDRALGKRYEIVLPHGVVWAMADDCDRALTLLADLRYSCTIHDRWTDSYTPTD